MGQKSEGARGNMHVEPIGNFRGEQIENLMGCWEENTKTRGSSKKIQFCDLSNVTKSSQVGQVAKWAFPTSDKTSMSFLKIIENFCLQDPPQKKFKKYQKSEKKNPWSEPLFT
jgi:hypothetical protein